MEFLANLWLPIVVSAVLVWIASFLTHMVFPHHKSEFKGLPNEDAFNSALADTPPGLYMFQWCTPAEMKDPVKMDRVKKGPNGMLSIFSGPVNMGQNLILTLLFYLVVSVFVAYLGALVIHAPTEYLFRFRVCGTVAFCAYGLGWIPFFIWFKSGKFWPNMFDSVLYALLTAGVFASMWPR